MQRIAVIGLGRFGMSLARQLGASGTQVMAIDRSAQLINAIKEDVDVAVRLDSTDETALAAQELDKFDVCVVAIGENFEAALLTTVIAKRIGVPRIICRAQTEFHAEIFRQIGAHEVLQPESRTGEHLARQLANPHLEDFIHLAEGYTLIELRAPQEFHGKTLYEIDLRKKFEVNLIAIKRFVTDSDAADDETKERPLQLHIPKPNAVIEPDDVMVLVGADDALARLPQE